LSKYNCNSMYLFKDKNDKKEFNDKLSVIEWKHLNEFNQLNGKWDIHKFYDALNTKYIGRTVVFKDVLSSTQTFLKQNANKFDNGTIVICNQQKKGKGRGGNVWESPKGCLMFTFTTKLSAQKVQYLPCVQYLISICIVDTILQLTDNKLQLSLKWPNDIYWSDGYLKLGGILCESMYNYTNKEYKIVSGIGLNIDNTEPTTCINSLIQNLNIIPKSKSNSNSESNSNHLNIIQDLLTTFEHRLSKEEILATFLNNYEHMFNEFSHHGFSIFRDKYLSYWMHNNQTVSVSDSNNNNKLISMNIIGISQFGMLKGKDKYGEMYELQPDGNTFDFLKGLIATKICKI